MRTYFGFAACLLMLAACDESARVETDAGRDAATGAIDAGRDAAPTPRVDSGPGDPCEATDENPIETVGCNGGVLGASVPANEFGGACIADEADAAGTCTNTNALCWANEDGDGLCLTTCTPSTDTYVSTGGCPTGSRCFDFGADGAFCFPDCNSATDCTSNSCDGEGSCVAPEPVPPADGGVSDGGVSDGGGSDGGSLLPDAGVVLPDAAATLDASAAP